VVIEQLMHRNDRSSEENELYELLIALVEKFEQEFYQPGSRSTPHSMLQFLMEQQGMTTANLAEVLGSEAEVEVILKGEREMSIAQIKSLSQLFKVEPSVFI
jgi:HTH-type transcriptional regulator/antitoxin HigA